MRNIVIIGAGAGGTMVANMLRKELDEEDFEITIIDRDEKHHYQPGYLFIPFGIYSKSDVLKPKREFIPEGVNFVLDTVVKVDTGGRKVETVNGAYDYDWLVIASGARIDPTEVDGMMDGWRKNIFDFYSLGGAVALRKQIKYFQSGKIVLNIADVPYKCPIAPLEFVFMADWFFTTSGVRDMVEIELVTPLDGVFTKPVATKALSKLAEKKNIKVTTQFALDNVDAKEQYIESADGRKVDFDLLVSVPPNLGDKCIMNSGMGDPMGFMQTDNNTLKAEGMERVFVLGDATNVPASKAGSTAHYQSSTVVNNLIREIDGFDAKPTFDGHATCFLASGYEKAVLLDFNYKVEPLQGMFPFPGMGPFDLLKESLGNYWGKMMFRWVYWNLMMKGHELPLEPEMSLAGKLQKYVESGQEG